MSGGWSLLLPHFGEVLIAGAVMALLAMGPPSALGETVSICDPFDDGSITDGDPLGWVHDGRGVFDAAGGDLCISGDSGGIWAINSVLIRGDQTVSAQVRIESTVTCYAWVLARWNGSSNYAAVIGTDGYLGIERDPGNSKIATGGISYQPGKDYLIELSILPDGAGITLELRAWTEGTARPEIPNIQAWDGNPLPEGYSGLGMSVWTPGGQGTACFRNFCVTGDVSPDVGACDDFEDGSIYDGDPTRWISGGNTVFDASSGDLHIAGGDWGWIAQAKESQQQIPGLDTLQTQVRIPATVTGNCSVWLVTRAQWGNGMGYNGVLRNDGYVAIERDDGAGDVALSQGQLLGFLADEFYGLELKLLPEIRVGDKGLLLELRVWRADTEERPEDPTLSHWDTNPLPIGFPLIGMSNSTPGGQGEAIFRHVCFSGHVAPTASFTVDPASGTASLEVTADAAATSAGAFPIASYEWDFGDGETGAGVSARHTYTTPGQHVIRLTVTDEEGGICRATETVRVGCTPQDIAPWVSANIGEPPWSGSASREGEEDFQICAAGRGFSGRADEDHFLYQEISGPFRVTARVVNMEGGGSVGRVGVMIRESLEEDAAFAASFVELVPSTGQERARGCSRKVSGDTTHYVAVNPSVVSDAVWVRLDRRASGAIIAKASADGESWSDEIDVSLAPPLPPTVLVGVAACNGTLPADSNQEALQATVTDLTIEPIVEVFKRGDANADGLFDLSDAVYTLGYLFLGQAAPPCLDAADANDDEKIDTSDAIYGLAHLFLGGPRLPEPFETCGEDPADPTGGGAALDCKVFPPC